MNYCELETLNAIPRSSSLMHRCFRGINGEAEHFFAITAPGGLNLAEQIKNIEINYYEKIRSLGLHPNTAVFRRVFLSDALNQIQSIRDSDLVHDSGDNPVAVSIIQQPPLPYAKVALIAYHIESEKPLVKQRLSPRNVLIRKNGLRHLWSTSIRANDSLTSYSPAAQTRSVFKDLIAALSSQGGSLYNNCIRTWIYVNNIDVFYEGMVRERKALFLKHGLREDTHFIASTGIGGAGTEAQDTVIMDAYSILGLNLRQISYLNDFNMLCAAKNYNVTFERGTRIAYADRAHYFIAGTASIDNQGNVLYPGDIRKQMDRALKNIDALLRAEGASIESMMYLIVYLRDPADFNYVNAELSQHLPFVPAIIVQGAICRPEWLIEIEGVAIDDNNQPSYKQF